MADSSNMGVPDSLLETVEKDQRKWLYDNDPVMHFSVNAKTERIIKCNKTAVTVLGYDSKEDLIGLPIRALYSEKAALKIPEYLNTFRTTGRLKNIEQEMLTKDRKPIAIILNSNAIRDEDGNIIASQSTCTDISKLKAVEKLLQEQKEKLETANRDLERFVTICSHDLKEPLATVKFCSDIIQKIYGDKLDKKGNEYLSYIQEATDRLARQITDLADHAKLGKNVDKEWVDIKELLAIVKYDLTKQISAKKATIKANGLPKILVYRTEFRLLLQNLISNALKYQRDDIAPQVHIAATRDEQFPDHWLFTVADNGMGIDMQHQEDIFLIFNRLVHKTHSSGSGVGLAHCEKIVELHNGTIWVESILNTGSTFFFTIKDVQ